MRLLTFFFGLWICGISVRAQGLTITHATIIDTIKGGAASDMTVVIKGDRIASIERSARLSAPAGTVVDAKGGFLIPGLVDMHTHVYFDGTAGDGSQLILPLLLINGVTGIRDMGSDLDSILHARSEVASHQMFGPRMVVSGPMLDGPKSPYKAVIPISTPGQGRKAVDMLKARGVDFIKIQSGVPRDAYFAIAQEATRLGIEFAGHVPDEIRAAEAVRAGQRSFEHLIGIFEASSPDESTYLTGKKAPGQFLATWNAKHEAEIIRLLAKYQVWQCPTLFWERGQWLVDAIDPRADPNLSFVRADWVLKQWPASKLSILKSLDTDPLPVRKKFVEHELGIVRRLHAANVPFLAGTDTPAGVDVLPGFSLHLELQRFTAAGFTPFEALQTATLNPARFLHRQNDFGSVEVGKIADLVLLSANPLEDISNTTHIGAVVADGHYISGQDIAVWRVKLKKIAGN